MTDHELNEFLENVIGVVEANTFETMCLWEKYSKQLSWIENLSGLGRQIGRCCGAPVFVSLRTAIVEGHKLLFIDPTSVIVDYSMIDEWLEKNLPETAHKLDGRINKTNALNFHNIFPRKNT